MKKWKVLIEKSKHFLLVTLLIIFTFCYAMFQGGFVSWFVFFTVSPFLLYAFVFLLVREEILLVERGIEPSHIESGQSAKVTITVERKTRFPFAYMMMEELVNSESLVQSKVQGANAVMFVGFKKKFSWSYMLENMPRGEHRYLGVTIVFSDFFGWAKKSVSAKKEQVILIYPRVREMKYAALQTKFDAGSMMSPYSIVKDTSMAVGLREYVPGDRFSWIHWKSFAKTQTLQSKEFEDRQSQELMLVLNAKKSPLFEEKIELVASILQTIVDERGDISFVSAGAKTKVFPLIQGNKQLDQVMHHLAAIKSTENIKFQLRDQRAFKHVATMLYVTSEVSDELLHTLATMVKSCICFVVAEQSPIQTDLSKRYKQVQVVHVNPLDYYHLFTEVMKP
ncbi:DUF58 domain-containing protein [Lysinibacillus pakistanensis]|uniref:DUF58 domain-containing protein n=1 Tax=Lysinibacillus pakistanensis TaxID=759811 RepID=A0AAX3WTY0_9BACI|nr:DUF58 domain-containing protein [Lysinibacillus pakistanensis]MDM5230527.1 DUF58 domain-containing protein [Lysinibacillus pakistanensis]WHY46109.1 DUF58 domain-containing protein [Lysinibacillus pakistanensis]WHY51120.1 DUF58 domain-containing protein [Lysinibacillus pakistanensis]